MSKLPPLPPPPPFNAFLSPLINKTFDIVLRDLLEKQVHILWKIADQKELCECAWSMGGIAHQLHCKVPSIDALVDQADDIRKQIIHLKAGL